VVSNHIEDDSECPVLNEDEIIKMYIAYQMCFRWTAYPVVTPGTSGQSVSLLSVIGEDGRFALTISEQETTSIDKCENALLRTCHRAIREAIRRHFTEISKKTPLE